MNWSLRSIRQHTLLTDEQAMGRVRSHGDHAAFGQLVERWETPIRRLCIRMTGDEHRGEDLAQEAFARVFASRTNYQDGRRFSTWLWRIALNLCYEQSRRVNRRLEVPLDIDGNHRASQPDATVNPHDQAIQSERAAMVRAALACLPEANRAVIVLREYEQLKFREIADVLDVPEGTVKWRMTEAMNQLSRQLKKALPDEDAQDGTRANPTKARVSL